MTPSHLPDVIGLCPDRSHTQEFYVPHRGTCPDEHYRRAGEHETSPDLVIYVPETRVLAALPDPARLNLVADWVEAQGSSQGTEVQDDLRRWAASAWELARVPDR